MPRLITKSRWPGTQNEFSSAVTAHQAAVEAHKHTVGEPAPLAHSLVTEVVTTGGAYEFPAPEVAPAPPSLADIQAARIVDLTTDFEMALGGGFASSALGTPHQYDSAAHDRENLIFAVVASEDTDYTCDDGDIKEPRLHTPAQLLEVLRAGKAVMETLTIQIRTRRAAVETATTEAEVAAVNW